MTMDIELISPADREQLVASVLWNNDQWAEVIAEGNHLKVELYAPPEGDAWRFDLDDAISALTEAKRWLLERLGAE